MYSNDFDDQLPFAYTFQVSGNGYVPWCGGTGTVDFSSFQGWTNFIFPYVKSGNSDFNNGNATKAISSLFVDPSYTFSPPTVDGAGNKANFLAVESGIYPYQSYEPNNVLEGGNLQLNCGYFGNDKVGNSPIPATTTQVGKPAQTILISQMQSHDIDPNTAGNADGYGNAVGQQGDTGTDGVIHPQYAWSGIVAQRSGGVYAFVDGHAKFIGSGAGYYGIDPAFPNNSEFNGVGAQYLPEPLGPLAASWRNKPNAAFAFGPRSGN
jgi:hypothetical protein